LSGSIPAELGDMTTLQNLDLDHNNLSGSIPSSLGNMPNLRNLNLNGNQLSGEIPSTFSTYYSRWESQENKYAHLNITFNALYTSDPTLMSALDQGGPGGTRPRPWRPPRSLQPPSPAPPSC
jgi:hypothetical protein